MRMVLVILCGLMIVFAGGCALVAIGSGALPVAAIPGAIVAANVLVILAVRGNHKPSFAAFIILAVLDFLIGLPMLWIMLTNAKINFEDEFQVGLLLLAVALVLKGILTIAAASRLRKQGSQALADVDSTAEDMAGW